MYGCETWTIGDAERKRLEAFEMWCYSRMMNIKRMDRITIQMKKYLKELEKEELCGRF